MAELARVCAESAGGWSHRVFPQYNRPDRGRRLRHHGAHTSSGRPIPGAYRLVRISRDLSAFSGNGPSSRPNAAAWRVLRLSWLAPAVLLAACASTPPHYPSQTAQRFIGKPLFSLEMHWSIPIALRHAHAHGGRRAIWKFNQYNYDGCRVTVFTDRKNIIRKVTWTTGCGPKAGATKRHPPAAKAP